MLESLQRLPISFGMALTTRDKCKRVASELVGKESLFVLGKGYAEPIALEGEWKRKEIESARRSRSGERGREIEMVRESGSGRGKRENERGGGATSCHL